MFKEGKEIVCVDNKEFIRLADAMQVIAPSTSNAARWFKQHQEASGILDPETFVYSNERFPGKRNQVWLTVPEGFQALAQACIKAPRLKVLEGVEVRIAPFVEIPPAHDEKCLGAEENPGEDVEIEFDLSPLLKSPHPLCKGGIEGVGGFDTLQSSSERPIENRSLPPGASEASQLNAVVSTPTLEAGPDSRDPAKRDFRQPLSPLGHAPTPNPDVSRLAEKEVLYRETQERMYGLSCPVEESELPSAFEEERDFLEHTLGNLVARYHAKMGWLKKMNQDAPPEIHGQVAELFNTLHDALLDGTITEILERPQEPPPHKECLVRSDTNSESVLSVSQPCRKLCSEASPRRSVFGETDKSSYCRNGQKEVEAILSKGIEEYLTKGYEVSFEVDKDGILCRILGEKVGVNAVAANWREAFVEAIRQIPKESTNYDVRITN